MFFRRLSKDEGVDFSHYDTLSHEACAEFARKVLAGASEDEEETVH